MTMDSNRIICLLVMAIYCPYVESITFITKSDEKQLHIYAYGIKFQENQLNFGLKVLGTEGDLRIKLKRSDMSKQYTISLLFHDIDRIIIAVMDANDISMGKQMFKIVNNCMINCRLLFQINVNSSHLTLTKIEKVNNQIIYYRDDDNSPENAQNILIRSKGTDAEWTFSQKDFIPESSSQPNDSNENTFRSGDTRSTSDETTSSLYNTKSKSDDATSISDTNTTYTSGMNAKFTPPPVTELTVFCPKVNKMQNVTIEELQEMITRLRSQLVVNKTELSSFIRARNSADDKRASATVIGYVSAAVLISLTVTMMMLDIPHLCRFLKCKNPRRKRNRYP